MRSFRLEMLPADGAYSPLMTRSKVDFPVPLAPISPIFSCGRMCQCSSLKSTLDPNSKVMSFSTNTDLEFYELTFPGDVAFNDGWLTRVIDVSAMSNGGLQ